MKTAQLYAAAITVHCPVCSAEQPERSTGSDMWEPQQLSEADGREIKCINCHSAFVISAHSRIRKS